MPITRFFVPFAAAYFLSSLFRAVIGVISPELAREFALTAQDLGGLASLYFYAFALAQIPSGVFLDRFGPRRAESMLILAAAAGALLFCFAHDFSGLAIGRILIGIGVAICFAAPLKAAAMWYPQEKQVALSGWIMLVGGLGATFATKPVQYALVFFDWRTLFGGLAILTVLAAIGIAVWIRDIPANPVQKTMAEQWRELGGLLKHPRFWWVMPWAFTGMGTFISVQGLWGMQWLIHGAGYAKPDAANLLFAMSLVALSGYFFIGSLSENLARRGLTNRHLLAAGMVVDLFALLAISLRWPGDSLWWCLYGLGTSLNVLSWTVLTCGLPKELAGRSNTGLNLFMFIGSGSISFLIGWIISTLQANGIDTREAFSIAFIGLVSANSLAAGWFLLRWKRFSVTQSG
ncbi:MAG: putative rane transport protein [Proteobacteria bacterium]|nr:putative rane transport protein [Pseudomonadota bacterium]